MSDRTAERRLSDLDFSDEDCHVALVDHGAVEHDETLVLKSKIPKPEQQAPKSTEPHTEPVKKETEMSKPEMSAEDVLELATLRKAQAEQLEVQKVEIAKAKEESEKELEVLRKAKADSDKELEVLRKAKGESEKAEFVSKAKELKVEEKECDAFGAALQVIKSANPEQYDIVMSELEKNAAVIKKMDTVISEPGSSEDGFDSVEFEEQVVAKGLELQKSNKKLTGAQARIMARKAIRKAAAK